MPLDSTRFEIVFRGDVAADSNVVDVKVRLQGLFKTDAARIDRIFTGRPVIIRKGLDRDSANRYKQTLEKAGAIVQIREQPPAVDTPDPAEGSAPPETTPTGWRVSPIGADVLRDTEKRDFKELSPDTSNISLAPSGTEVLKDEERSPVERKDVDTSHLSVDS